MSLAADKMKRLIIEVTPDVEQLLRQFVREACICHNNNTFSFSEDHLEYFINCHKTKEDE